MRGSPCLAPCCLRYPKGQTQCIEAPTQGGVWGGIIGTYSYPCKVQCREAGSNPGPLGTSGEDLTTAPRPALKYLTMLNYVK